MFVIQSVAMHLHVTVQALAGAVVDLFGLDDLADLLGVSVVIGALPKNWWGAFHAVTRTITMKHDLTTAQFRSVLAHELGHANFGHVYAESQSRNEQMADRFAAKHLIRLDDWIAAGRKHGFDVPALARELDVMPWVITEFSRTSNGALFARCGTGNYKGRPPYNLGLVPELPAANCPKVDQMVTGITEGFAHETLVLR